MEIYTIGHSNHSIEAFIALIEQHGITAVADVRSHPHSRYLPHFNQGTLKDALLNAGIRYVFLGKELGARPEDPSCYVGGKALYERIAATPLFSQGIERLLKGAETYKIALMCAEKDPMTCHRTILVCRHLQQREVKITHILPDGKLESHEHLEDRLLETYGLHQLSLFDQRSLEERILEAYTRQADKIAYVKGKSNNEESPD